MIQANASGMSPQAFKTLLQKANVADSNYPLASLVWLPYGTAMLRRFSEIIRELFRAHDFEEYIFPSLVSWHEFDKINKNIYHFDDMVYRPTEAIAMRPSGESAMYPMFRRWIRTTDDLPLKAYQIGSNFRKGRPAGIFRQNEVAFFVEAHTAHATREEALSQLEVNNSINREMLRITCVPNVETIRPSFTNKPVAEIHVGFDALLPTGETLLVGSSYAQMQIFSRIFDIVFTKEKKKDFTYQTEIGFSYRMLLTSLWLSSDEKGLRLLPDIAPVQVCIMGMQPDDKDVREQCATLAKRLSSAGIRTECELRNVSIQRRFETIETRGIPVRICIGKRELGEQVAQVQRRDTGVQTTVKEKDVETYVAGLLVEIRNVLAEDIQKKNEGRILHMESFGLNDVELAVKRVLSYRLCFAEPCVRALESKIGKGEVLGLKTVDTPLPCAACGASTAHCAFISRRI